MSKAILVIDMPSSCFDCKLQDWLNCRIAKGCHTGKSRPDWCPLCELPEKKEEHPKEYYEFGSIGLAYVIGYNACIDELTAGSSLLG